MPMSGDSDGSFDIGGAQETDSLGTTRWKHYQNSRKRLLSAWSPPQGSFYARFAKTKTIDSIDSVGSRLKPRFSEYEAKCQRELSNLVTDGSLGRETAIVLDSGGAHSVAMAVKLSKNGYQPVVMFDSVPHLKGSVSSQQGLATLLYFAAQIEELKQSGTIRSDSPPVFILDTHRSDRPFMLN